MQNFAVLQIGKQSKLTLAYGDRNRPYFVNIFWSNSFAKAAFGHYHMDRSLQKKYILLHEQIIPPPLVIARIIGSRLGQPRRMADAPL